MNKGISSIYSPGRMTALSRVKARLDAGTINAVDKDLIISFDINLSVQGASVLRRAKLMTQLMNLSEWNASKNNCSLAALERENLFILVSHINDGLVRSEATKCDFRRCIRQFYSWYRKQDPRLQVEDKLVLRNANQFYEALRAFKTTYAKAESDPNTIIQWDDVITVLDKGCGSVREKAFISLLHETGCRSTEFLNLRIGDIHIAGHTARINVPDGKTGRRVVWAYESLPYLRVWLENHPQKERKDAFLWTSESTNYAKGQLKHQSAHKLVDRVFTRAGVTKRHNLHWFRHSRASILAPKITEVLLCKFMGWRIGSQMVKIYSHLCVQDLEHALMKAHGLEENKQKEQPVKCDCCNALNAPTARYCYRCNRPLTFVDVIADKQQIDEQMSATLQAMMQMLRDPEMMRRFEAFKASAQGNR